MPHTTFSPNCGGDGGSIINGKTLFITRSSTETQDVNLKEAFFIFGGLQGGLKRFSKRLCNRGKTDRLEFLQFFNEAVESETPSVIIFEKLQTLFISWGEGGEINKCLLRGGRSLKVKKCNEWEDIIAVVLPG